MGPAAGGDRLHRGGDDGVCSPAGARQALGLRVAGAQASPGAGRVSQGGAPPLGKPSSGHGWANGLPAEPSLAMRPTQYHINKLSQSGEVSEPAGTDPGLDDLDAALNNLEVKLEGSTHTDVLVRGALVRGQGWGKARNRPL